MNMSGDSDRITETKKNEGKMKKKAIWMRAPVSPFPEFLRKRIKDLCCLIKLVYFGIEGLVYFKVEKNSGFSAISRNCTTDKTKLLKNIYHIIKSGRSEKDFSPLSKALWDNTPEIKTVIEKRGIEVLKANSFNVNRIKELAKNEHLLDPAKLAFHLDRYITVGNTYSRKELKRIIAEVYQAVGIKKKAKATDIEKYYKARKTTKYGKPNINCYQIIEKRSAEELSSMS